MTKGSPGVVLLPPATTINVSIPVRLFVIANNPAPGCAACPSPVNPVSAKIDMTMSPLAGGPTTATASISTSAGTMTLPMASPVGTFNSYAVSMTVPAGTATGAYRVVGRTIVDWSDGISLNQSGDTVVCLVDPAPGNPAVPRLDMQLLTPTFPRMAGGDQHVMQYRITNNDPANSVTVTAFANAKQAAIRPQGANETRGVFSIANAFGDDFPIAFGNGACLALPGHPYTQPEIMMPIPPIPPNSFFDVFVRIRSYGMCASGSCSESTLRVDGMFADNSPAFACAGMALNVDASMPTTQCLPRTDDCNNNGTPDPIDIANGTAPDQNYNAVIDSCEAGQAPIIPNPGQVTPSIVQIGGPIQVSVIALPDFGMPTSNVITNVFANGVPLNDVGGNMWQGTIPADTRPGPQTVYFLAVENNGAIATHIGVYTVVGPQSCPVTVLANNGFIASRRAPTLTNRFQRDVYLITAAEIAASGLQSGTPITTVGWNYGVAGPSGAAPLIVYMQNTTDATNTKSTNWATAIGPMTVVHNGTMMVPSAAGPFDLVLQGGSPFSYTGGGLYVGFDWGAYGGTLSTTNRVLVSNNVLPNGNRLGFSDTAAPATVAVDPARPETRLSSRTQNDAAVSALYSYGELPIGLVPPQQIMASISNKGVLAQTDLPVSLNATGVDAFTETQTIPTLTPCSGQATVSFPPFSPSSLGNDTLTVSVPADDVGANNSLSRPLSLTPLSYSYKYPGSTATGGAGFTGATGAFVGKFTITTANAITDVKLEFAATSATTYRVAIYPDSGSGTPSTSPLYVDAADRTVSAAGPVTITLPSPVAVAPGNFFVGIQQTNTTNAAFSVDTEVPIRSGSFYFATPNPSTSWTDFSPGTNFKLNVGVLLQTAAPTFLQAVSEKTHGGAGTFDVDLPTTGTPGIECRTGGPTNDYTIVAIYSGNISVTGSPQAQVISGSATIGSGGVSNGGMVSVSANMVTIPLTNVANVQTINVRLNGVNGSTNAIIPMSLLVGDSSGNGSTNAGDISQTKSRIGQTVTGTNFRSDINANGSTNAGDVGLVKANIGNGLAIQGNCYTNLGGCSGTSYQTDCVDCLNGGRWWVPLSGGACRNTCP